MLLLQHNASNRSSESTNDYTIPLLSTALFHLIIGRYTKAPSQTQRLVYLSTVYSAITTNYTVTITPMHDFSRPCAVFPFRRQLSLNENAITFLIKQMRRTDQAQHKLDWLIFFLFSFSFFRRSPMIGVRWVWIQDPGFSKPQHKQRLTPVWWDFYQFDRCQPESGDSSLTAKIGLSPVGPILHTANELSTLIIP